MARGREFDKSSSGKPSLVAGFRASPFLYGLWDSPFDHVAQRHVEWTHAPKFQYRHADSERATANIGAYLGFRPVAFLIVAVSLRSRRLRVIHAILLGTLCLLRFPWNASYGATFCFCSCFFFPLCPTYNPTDRLQLREGTAVLPEASKGASTH